MPRVLLVSSGIPLSARFSSFRPILTFLTVLAHLGLFYLRVRNVKPAHFRSFSARLTVLSNIPNPGLTWF